MGGGWSLFTPDGGYPGTLNGANEGGHTNDAFSASSGKWAREVFDLSPYAGNNARLRMVFTSDGSVTRDGWYIDDITFIGGGGIHIGMSNGNLIENNICDGNDGNGAYMEDSYNNTLRSNSFSHNIRNGIYAETSENNSISQNAVEGNSENGIHLKSSSRNTIDNNTVSQSIDGIVVNNSTSNRLSDNTVLNNGKNGIILDHTESTLLENNTCSFNFEGIYLDHSDNCILEKNRCNFNRDNGIFLMNSYSDIVENKCINNTWNGISILDYWGIIADNECKNNSQTGIYVEDALLSIISGNVVNNNYFGTIIKAGSAYNWIDNNTCNNNDFYGMTLYDNCFNNTVENNSLGENRFGLYIYRSHNNTMMFNNLINNTEYGINISDTSSRYNSIHHNSFLYNNGSSIQAYDNGLNNSWDDGAGEGNFWENYPSLYPQANNDGNVWNTPYNISGQGGTNDSFPLFYAGPGADTELPEVIADNTPTAVSTGDPITFSGEFADNLGIVAVNVLYSYDGINFANESMAKTRGEAWTYTMNVDNSATDLFYRYYIKDVGRNHVLTDITALAVSDDDLPFMGPNNTPDTATTGDPFGFSVMLDDNVGVSDATAYYSYDGFIYDPVALVMNGNIWSGTFTVAEDAVEFYYYFGFSDGTNPVETPDITVTVLDNDPPELDVDETPVYGTTGDPFEFKASFTDNIMVSLVRAEYSLDGGSKKTVVLEEVETGIWNSTIIIDGDTSEMEYRLFAEDDANNELSTGPSTVDIRDNDAPIADAGDDMLVELNDMVLFDGSNSSDNVGVDQHTWSFVYNGLDKEMEGETVEFKFEIPGVYNIVLNVSDADGNCAIDIIHLTVRDNVPPRAKAGDDIIIDQHMKAEFIGDESVDNQGIADFNWSFIDNGKVVFLEGSKPSYVFDEAGKYTVTLNVTDLSGNWDNDTMSVTVKDITAPASNAGADLKIDEGTTILLDGLNSTDNVKIISYEWSFEYDDLPKTLYGIRQSFEFKEKGSYEITLRVTDGSGNIGTDTILITVVEGEPGDEDDDDTGVEDFLTGLDLDGDNMDDGWEDHFFGGDADPYADPDKDGYKNIYEFDQDTDPKVSDREAAKDDGEETEDKGMSSVAWYIIVAALILVILIIVFIIVVISRRSKREEDIFEKDILEEDEIETEDEGSTEVISETKSISDHDDIVREMDQLTEVYVNCSEAGMDVSGFEGRYEELKKYMELEEYGEAIGMISPLIEDLETAYYAYYDELKVNAKKLHRTVNSDFKKAMSSGIDIKEFRADYESAISRYKEEDFYNAIEQFTLVMDRLHAASGQKKEELPASSAITRTDSKKREMDIDSLFTRILPPARNEEKEEPENEPVQETLEPSSADQEKDERSAGSDDEDLDEVGVLTPLTPVEE